MTRRYWNIHLEEMMEAGVHFGHASFLFPRFTLNFPSHFRSYFNSHFSSITYWTTSFSILSNRLLRQCNGIRHCKQVHSATVVTGACSSAFVAARLVSVYARSGFVFDARKVFDTVPFEGLSNLLFVEFDYRANVDGYSREALQLYGKMKNLGFWLMGLLFLWMFLQMELEGVEPNPVTWTSLLSSHARYIGQGSSMVHGYIVKGGGFEDYLFAKNALITVGQRTLRTAAEMEWLGRNMGRDGAVVEEKGLEAVADDGRSGCNGRWKWRVGFSVVHDGKKRRRRRRRGRGNGDDE
ncbi:putative pentatricopeptide repeat-containing protein, partial [Cucurbita argyrosperma subsp. sororia]